MLTILLAIGLIAVFFILMGIRIICLKQGGFKGTCASQSPFLKKEGHSCGYCEKKSGGEGCGAASPDFS